MRMGVKDNTGTHCAGPVFMVVLEYNVTDESP